MYLFILAYLILLLSLFTYDERFNLPTNDTLSPNQIPKIPVEKIADGTLPDGVQTRIDYNKISNKPPTAAPLNLSGYVSTNALSTALGSYVSTNALSTALGSYVSTNALSTALGSYVTTNALSTALGSAGGGYKANDSPTFGAVTCSSLNITSDRRIKKNIQPLVSLDLLRKLKPVRYQLKNGQKEVCGFIAQEIQETIPEAVSTQMAVMPNICDEATVDKDILTFSTFLTSDLSYDPEEKPYKLKVDESLVIILEVLDEHRVRINKELVNKELIDKELINKVYVLGQEVSDFLSIDSHQIFTVATCALQELDAKVHQMDAKVHHLDEKVQRLEEENKALLQRFNRLEECLNSRNV